jgi:hypothetical protein
MMFFGQTEHGVYIDDCEGVHPDVINQYYGIHGRQTRWAPDQTGAGHPEEEDDADDWEDLEEMVGADQEENIRHEPIEVPETADPFSTPELRVAFEAAFASVQEHGLIPTGYGLLPEEWDDSLYPSVEVIRSGRRGTKELAISLPDFLWRPKAEMWGQALDILTHIEHMYGGIVL